MCVGLFYVGHGLHGPQHSGVPSLENRADAADVAWHPDSPEMFTVSQDGRIVYTWKRFKDVREGAIVVRYIGHTAVPSEHQPGLVPGQGFPGALVPVPVPERFVPVLPRQVSPAT
jgi:hypothetical protein